MKTTKYQWMKDLHWMTFVFLWLGILYLLIFEFLWRIPICISSVFVIINIFFAPQPCYLWERRKEKSDYGFIRIHYDNGCTFLFIWMKLHLGVLCVFVYFGPVFSFLLCQVVFLHKLICLFRGIGLVNATLMARMHS